MRGYTLADMGCKTLALAVDTHVLGPVRRLTPRYRDRI